jgi:hypothetical protein
MTKGKIMTAAANVVALPVRAALVCSSCGAPGEGSCRCGVAYVPPGQRAADAVKANPDKSDRAIAADLGVSQPTVSRARRKSVDTNVSTGKRTGKDGKKYKARKPPKAKPKPAPVDPIQEPCDDCTTAEDRWQNSFMHFAADAVSMSPFWDREFGAAWKKYKPTAAMVTLAEEAIEAWRVMLSDMKRRK